jgi:hypothetical protein
MLNDRTRQAKCRREAAKATYAEALLAENAGCDAADALLAAMDELSLDIDHLSSDARAVEAGRRLERQLADAEDLRRDSMAAVAAAERNLHEVQGRWHDPGLNKAHAEVAEAENLRLDHEQHVTALRQQLQAVTLSAPRVFAGRPRVLALARTPRGTSAVDAVGNAVVAGMKSGNLLSHP